MPVRTRFASRRTLTAWLMALAAAFVSPSHAAAQPSGEQLYKEHCVRCHGADGQGAKKTIAPLAGEKSVAQLAKVIDATMPEDDPDKLDAAESARVAAYIHEAFYSPTAQARVRPARIDLARLTVGQYRNAAADVVAGFRPAAKLDARQGLKGEYFNARGFQGNKRVIDRIDPEVKFDFGKAAPGEKFDTPHQFAIRWEGSVVPPDSGSYEFVVRTEHGTKLFVNDNKTPLIDAWVKSGKDTEFRGTVHLLAGRAVPIRLEFSKAKQGVDDSKTNPNPPLKPASITLLWKPPHRAEDVIPARHLSPVRVPESYVVSAPFPPDDRSLGWERGTTVSKEWDGATTEAAIETVNYLSPRLNEFAGTNDAAADRPAKLKAFAVKFAERAFRRPLTPDDRSALIDRQFAAADPELALKRVIVLVMKSPRFLYREVSGPNDAYAVASRLSFTLWDSGPDDELLRAAAAGQLATPAQVQAQAERMLADPRAKAKIRQFLLTWLRVDQPHDVAKNPQRFPGFDGAAVADLRTSLELFLDEIVWSPEADFRKLFLADTVALNARLAGIYGVEVPADAGFRPVRLDDGKRFGVLTHPYLLATFAYTSESAPIHRGVFLARGVLGLTLRPPQEAFTPFAADLHPTLTTRERTGLQTRPAACATCHGVINPLGFVLENYDAVGRFRDRENDKPVDSSGKYHTRAGADVTFAGPAELARFLATSPEVHTAFAEQLFHHLAKQPTRAYGPRTPDDLGAALAANGFNIRKLVVRAAVLAALPPPPPTNR
jgi:mono/diheme cytochrome c family protein